MTIGAAIITRNELEKLKELLEQLSALDQVVVVDTGSRDGTPKHVRSLGSPFELHEFKWRPRPDGSAPDDWGFAAARNDSFRHLKTTHAIWLDSDDLLAVVKDGERTRTTAAETAELLRGLASNPIGADAWLMPYLYSTDEFGNPTSVLAKERLLKMDVGWRWHNPIHEVLTTVHGDMKVRASTVRDFFVVHRPHETGVSVRRNAPMVRAWLRQLERFGAQDDELSRARYLVGRSLFGQGRFNDAARWLLTNYLGKHPDLSPEERWQGWLEVAKNLVNARDIEGAASAAVQAIGVCPRFGEAYVLLADMKLQARNRPSDILKLLEIADSCANEDHGFVESNPLAMSFNVATLAAECHIRMGHYREALALADRALSIRPSDAEAHRLWTIASESASKGLEAGPALEMGPVVGVHPSRPAGSSPPVFVVSSGRCGSTLLSNMLNLHPEILSLSEFLIMLMPGAFVEGPAPIHGPQFWALLNTPRKRMTFMYQHDVAFPEVLYRPGPGRRFTAETGVPPILLTALPHLTDDPEALYDEIREFVLEQGAYSLSSHYSRLFDWLRVRFGRKLWVERSGSSMGNLREILRYWPDARFIHLFRDGRECAISMSRHSAFRLSHITAEIVKYTGVDPHNTDEPRMGEVPAELQPYMPETFDREAFWNFDIPLEAFGSSWNVMERRGIELLSQLPAGSVHLVRYENLVVNPKAVLTTLMGFLGVSSADAYLDRAAALVKANPPKWPQLPEGQRHRLDQACRIGMALLYGGGELYAPEAELRHKKEAGAATAPA